MLEKKFLNKRIVIRIFNFVRGIRFNFIFSFHRLINFSMLDLTKYIGDYKEGYKLKCCKYPINTINAKKDLSFIYLFIMFIIYQKEL